MSEIRNESVAATAVSDGLERDLWLVPIEDRRQQGALRELTDESHSELVYSSFCTIKAEFYLPQQFDS